MELRALHTFALVAAELNLHRAAEQLGVTQPAVTVQIAAMEEELGFDLFVREKHRFVSLTAAGKTYLAYVRRILTEFGNAAHRAREVGRGKAGILRIGLSEEVATADVLAMIASIRTAMADIAFEFVELAADQLTAAVKRADVDLCITQLPCDGTGLRLLPLWRECWTVAMQGDHPLASHPSLGCEDLSDTPIILGPIGDGNGGRSLLLSAFDHAMVAPRIVARAQRRSVALTLVNAGIGVAFLPDFIRQLGLTNLTMVPFRDAEMSLALVCPEASPRVHVDMFERLALRFQPGDRRKAATAS